MRIILCDLETEGHHCIYLNLFATEFIQLGYQVLIFSPASQEMIFGDDGQKNDKIRVIQITGIPSEPANHNFFATRAYVASLWKYTSEQLNANKVDNKEDLVFFSSMDEYITPYIQLSVINHLFPFKWSGLYIKPKYIRTKQSYSFLRKHVLNMHYLLRSKNCMGFALLDNGIKEKMKKLVPGKPVYFLPDIIDEAPADNDFQLIHDIKRRADGRKCVLLIGAIDKRKNIVNFIKASQRLDSSKYFFVAAGIIAKRTFSGDEISFISQQSENLLISNAKIATEAEFNGLIANCDVLFAAYLNFPYSSNMIGKAAFYRKPVIVSKHGVMEEITTRYSLGTVVNGESADEIAAAVELLAPDYKMDFMSIERYNKDFSRNRFRENLGNLIKEIEPQL